MICCSMICRKVSLDPDRDRRHGQGDTAHDIRVEGREIDFWILFRKSIGKKEDFSTAI